MFFVTLSIYILLICLLSLRIDYYTLVLMLYRTLCLKGKVFSVCKNKEIFPITLTFFLNEFVKFNGSSTDMIKINHRNVRII